MAGPIDEVHEAKGKRALVTVGHDYMYRSDESQGIPFMIGKIGKHGWAEVRVSRCVCIAARPELRSNGLQKLDDGVVFKLFSGVEGQMLQYVCHPSLLKSPVHTF